MAGKLLYANGRLQPDLGYTLDEVTGRDVFDFVDAEYHEACAEAIKSILEVGAEKTKRVQLKLRCKDGSWIDVEVAGDYFSEPQEMLALYCRSVELHARMLEEARRSNISCGSEK